MKVIKSLVVLVFIMSSIYANAQITVETGVPSLIMNIGASNSSYKLDHYLKVGKKVNNFEYGILGIARLGEPSKKYDFTVGPYLNYTIEPFKKVPILIVPEVRLLASKRQYNSTIDPQTISVLSGNVSLGLGYKFNENWSLMTSISAGYGQRTMKYSSSSVGKDNVFHFPMGLSIGAKYTFKTRE